MATKVVCDGTGAEIAEDTPTTGHFGNQYCEQSRIVAEQYLEDLDALHTETASIFQTKLAQLRARYHEKLQRLPDEP